MNRKQGSDLQLLNEFLEFFLGLGDQLPGFFIRVVFVDPEVGEVVALVPEKNLVFIIMTERPLRNEQSGCIRRQ